MADRRNEAMAGMCQEYVHWGARTDASANQPNVSAPSKHIYQGKETTKQLWNAREESEALPVNLSAIGDGLSRDEMLLKSCMAVWQRSTSEMCGFVKNEMANPK